MKATALDPFHCGDKLDQFSFFCFFVWHDVRDTKQKATRSQKARSQTLIGQLMGKVRAGAAKVGGPNSRHVSSE